MRTFASRTDKDLAIGVSIAVFIVFIVLALVGAAGLIAVWSGIPHPGGAAFFLLVVQLPAWVVGLVIVMVIALSTAGMEFITPLANQLFIQANVFLVVFDSLQSAMVSTASSDLFRNRLPLLYIRGMVVLMIIPVIAIAIKAPSILQIFLISNLAASASVPCIFLGLSNEFYFLRGFDVVVGGLGGIFSVFIFGLIFYNGDAHAASKLLMLATLYANDWSVFGTFLVAPVAGLLITGATSLLRNGVRWVVCKTKGVRFDGFDSPTPLHGEGDGRY